MITKPILGIICASVVLSGSAGYFAGKISSGASPAFDTRLSGNSVGLGNHVPQGFDENASNGNRKESSSSQTRMSLGDISDQSWHQYRGPYTAESWMAIRLAVLGAPLSQVEETLAKLAELPVSQERIRLEREVLAMWATREPLAALDYASSIEAREDRNDAREDILKVWAGREPKRVFDWLESQQDLMPANELASLFDDAIRGYADLNLSEAINYFNTMSESLGGRQKASGMGEIIESLIQQGELENATQFIDLFSDPNIRQEASQELISELAQVDVKAALDLLQKYQDSTAYTTMQEQLVEAWAENDPEQAAAYITSSVEVGAGFSEMASRVMRNWGDLEASSQWLAQYEPSPELDRPTMMLVYRAGRDDPEGALSWAGTVTDDGMQRRALEMVAGNWKASDEAAVNQFLAQSSDLSPEQKKVIMEAPARSFERGRGGGWGGGRGGGGR